MKTRSLLLFASFTIFAGLAIESCKHSAFHPLMPVDTISSGNGGPIDTTHYTPKHTCSPDSVYFVNDILPLITSSCSMTGCHNGSSRSDDLRALTSYSTIMSYVRAGNPTSSKLYTEVLSKKMPRYPVGSFSASKDSFIYNWIKQGALNNQCDACDTSNVTFSSIVFPIVQVSCSGCHSGNSPSGGISLTNYQQIQTQVANGNLLGSVTYSKGFIGMPVSNKLSDCDVNSIRIWIQKGAPNN